MELFMIPAKPLAVHPLAVSSITKSDSTGMFTRPLQIYNVMHKTKPDSQRGVALLLIDSAERAGKIIPLQLAPLPAVPADANDEIPEPEVLDYEKPEIEQEEVELPPHLKPQAMDDNIPWGDPADAIIYDNYEETPGMLAELKQCPDFDPTIYLDQVEQYDPTDLRERLDEYDAVDMKNCDNWTSRYDPEAPFFTRDDYAWLRADIQECAKGAMLTLHESLNLPNKTVKEVIVSEDYTDLPLSPSSPLARYLLIYFVTQSRPCGPKYQDGEFGKMYERMANLMSHEHFRRTSCFRQRGRQDALARWVVVQEFTHLSTRSWWLALKKREAEYWWRKNGWDRVLVEFFIFQEG